MRREPTVLDIWLPFIFLLGLAFVIGYGIYILIVCIVILIRAVNINRDLEKDDDPYQFKGWIGKVIKYNDKPYTVREVDPKKFIFTKLEGRDGEIINLDKYIIPDIWTSQDERRLLEEELISIRKEKLEILKNLDKMIDL